MEGNRTITCLPNGTWSNYPICHGMMIIFHVQAKRIKEREEYGLIDLVKCSEEVVKEISFGAVTCIFLSLSLSFFHQVYKRSISLPVSSLIKHFLFLADCPVLNAPENGSVSSFNRTYGSTVTVTCKDRFYLNGSEHLVCQENGKWSDHMPNCVGKMQDTFEQCH